MRQHDSENKERGSSIQQAVVLEHACTIGRSSPLVRCQLPLEVCRALAIHQSLNIQDIADALDLEHSQVSKCISKLTSLGIVQEQHRGRCTDCRLSDSCVCSCGNGMLRLSLTTPEGHQISFEGPDTQPQAPEWFAHISLAAGGLLFPLNRCRAVMCILLWPGLCVSEIAQRCGQSLSLASHHVQAIRRAGIVDYTERQQQHLFHISSRCRPTRTPESLQFIIPCDGDSTLSLSVRLTGALSHENDASIGSQNHVNTGSLTCRPEIRTKPRSGKFARDQ